MTPWLPDDDELDAVARTLEPLQPTSERAEQLRTSLLAGAATQRQLSRRSLAPYIVGGAAIAAAAMVALWLARSPESTRETITAVGAARFERASGWPDYVVRLDDGVITVAVASLEPGERFRITTPDAEVELRAANADVGATHDRLASVAVREGQVEVRVRDAAPVVVAAGHSWSATITARRDVTPRGSPTTDTATPATPSGTSTTVSSAGDKSTTASSAGDVTTTASSGDKSTTRSNPTNRSMTASGAGDKSTTVSSAGDVTTTANPSGKSTTASPANRSTTPNPTNSSTTVSSAGNTSTTASPTTKTPTDPASPPGESPTTSRPGDRSATTTPQPGEAEFRAGWAALKAGDAAGAVVSLSAACTAALHDALGEDACFWLGAAAKRAGDTSTAHAALARFIAQFPSSARVAEASALLGWLLYDAGDLDGAEQRFHRAEHDRVPAVRDSAERGLTAIARRRKP